MADIKPRPMQPLELAAMIDNELDEAMGYISGELAKERSDAMDRYLGEPLGNEMEGRSQVHSRDVLETIEWIMPTLVEIFTAKDRAVEFVPEGPEDEEQAEQEADYLNYLFYKKIDGFLTLYSWFKDALLQKNGVIKVYPEEYEKVTTEKYKNLTEIEYQSLMADDEVEIKELETERGQIFTEQGYVPVKLYNCTITKTEDDVRYQAEVVPPEEFVISKDAKSVKPCNARFCAHITDKTISELREIGYSDSQISKMDIGENEVDYSEESLSRHHLSDESHDDVIGNIAMRKVRVKECYVYADMNGDGIAELLKVFRSGKFIDWEEIDFHPFVALTPVILTHKYYGLSVADLVKDIQELRTMLFRAYFDNINQLINGVTYYDENTVNLDDMLTSKPFGIRAVNGPPGQSVYYVPSQGLPPEAFTLNEMLDKFLHSRIGDFQTQLDPNVLADANNGVVFKILAEAKSKVLMIARIFAEVGVKELFRTLHHLVRKFSDQEDRFKLRNTWVPVNPQEWRERHNLTVKVGLGTQDNMAELANLNQIKQNQMEAAQLGLPVVTPENIYNLHSDMAELMGHVSERYFTHPQMIPPPPQQQDPQIELIRMQQQVETGKLQLQAQKDALEHQRKVQELEIRAGELANRASTEQGKQELELIKAQIGELKSVSEAQIKAAEIGLKEREMELKETSQAAQMAMDVAKTETQAYLDKYKTDISAQIEILKQENENNRLSQDQEMKMIGELMAQVQDMKSKSTKKVVYDDNGRIVQIGDQVIKRDENGRAIEID